MSALLLGFDPFFCGHPTLSHHRVEVTYHLLDEPGGMTPKSRGPGTDTRRVDWMSLTVEERLELERLLAKACS